MPNCSDSEAPRRRRVKGDRRVAFFFSVAAAIALLALAGCADDPPAAAGGEKPWRGSVVIFSFDALRADHVGALGGLPGITPELDRFAAEADYAGRAVASSSSPLIALASSFTGTGALQHRLLGHLDAHLRPSLPTIAELFWSEGYDTVFFEPRPAWMGRYGLLRGIARTEATVDRQVLHELPLFDELPRFYWIVLPEADAPYTDRSAELPGRGLPVPARKSVGGEDLMPHADPRRPLPDGLRADTAALFRLEAAAGDARLGRYLDALRRSEAWDEALVVATAITGTELGEHGSALYSQNLYRESIEVPLLIKLPKSFAARGRAIAEKKETPVAAERLFATLAESIGKAPAPICSPSLFRQARRPAVSALPMRNGINLYSAVFPSPRPGVLAEQLIRTSSFGPGEESYYAAQAAEAGAAVTLPEQPRQLFERLHGRFEEAPPWQSAEVKAELWTWNAASGASLDFGADPARLRQLGERLETALLHHLDADRPAGQEEKLVETLEMSAGEGGTLERKDQGAAAGKGESTRGGAGP